MEPSPSTDTALAPPERGLLLALARRSIEHGLRSLRPAEAPAVESLPEPLGAPGASFVTLTDATGLRGCRGALEPFRPLAHDVWYNAWSSAFDDPRFAPLGPDELGPLRIEVSLLSALEPLLAETEAELLDALTPHHHGVVLALGPRRATFLPQVWESLPEPASFLEALRAKAGLPRGFWSPEMRAWRYTVDKLRPPG
jgi:AmmeMemoRadiSam system protein A